MARDEYEARLEQEQRDKEWAEEYFRVDYPSVLAAVKRVVSKEAGDALYMKEGIFEHLLFKLGEDLSQFDFRDALALAGRQPFNPWDASKMRAAE